MSRGALLVTDPMFFGERARIAELASKHRLPMITAQRTYAEAGGLMPCGPDVRDQFRRAATYVDKIPKAARPGDLPIEQPAKFELVVNLKTAEGARAHDPAVGADVGGRPDSMVRASK